MAETFDLARFVHAQAGIYPHAIAELQSGEKRTHWMWFVFPQVLGLGLSTNARLYGISSAEEARAFFAHELLGHRLREATDAMLRHAGKRMAVDILGPIDTLKFRSSMTLFEHVAPQDDRFARALDGVFDGERDMATLAALEGQSSGGSTETS